MTDVNDTEEALGLAQEIIGLLKKAKPETGKRAMQAALALFGETEVQPLRAIAPQAVEFSDFFNRTEHMKPSDYAQLCAAYHYSTFGAVPFSLDEIRSIGADAGLVLPDRLDKTFNQATSKGRKLFQQTGKGTFRATAAAGLLFRERWNVAPGKQPRQPSDQTRDLGS